METIKTPKQVNQDYQPFGPAWEKEMMKWSKKDLINMIKDSVDNLNDLPVPGLISRSVVLIKKGDTLINYGVVKKIDMYKGYTVLTFEDLNKSNIFKNSENLIIKEH